MVTLENTLRKFSIWYAVVSIISFLYLVLCGHSFLQYKPVLFFNQADLSMQLVMLTGIHKALIKSRVLAVVLDVLFLALPLFLAWLSYTKKRLRVPVAVLTFLFFLVYGLLQNLFVVSSIGKFLGLMVVPLFFTYPNATGAFHRLMMIRWFFLLNFFTAGLWKFKWGGIFNLENMSAILYRQHLFLMETSPRFYLVPLYKFLIAHPATSYSLYLAATILELIFVVGFFTRKWDKWLMVLLVVFLLFDIFIMRINYQYWIVFIPFFWYSNLFKANKHGQLVE